MMPHVVQTKEPRWLTNGTIWAVPCHRPEGSGVWMKLPTQAWLMVPGAQPFWQYGSAAWVGQVPVPSRMMAKRWLSK